MDIPVKVDIFYIFTSINDYTITLFTFSVLLSEEPSWKLEELERNLEVGDHATRIPFHYLVLLSLTLESLKILRLASTTIYRRINVHNKTFIQALEVWYNQPKKNITVVKRYSYYWKYYIDFSLQLLSLGEYSGGGTNITGENFDANLINLKRLDLTNCSELTNEGLVNILQSCFLRLRDLNLSSTRISGSSFLAFIGKLNLKRLDLSGCVNVTSFRLGAAQATVGVNLCYLRVGENMESHVTELLPNIQLLQPLPNIEKTS